MSKVEIEGERLDCIAYRPPTIFRTAAGKVPGEVSVEAAQAAARQAALNALAAVRSVLGSLDSVDQVVRLTVYVNSSDGFTDQAKIANGASELLGAVFSTAGIHARSAVGVAELPLNASVELELVVTVDASREEHTNKALSDASVAG